ncbi:DEAD/DEAH box helicase [candidate division WWE3 bacterium]|nr:DEAD/DEAH box helicase [candidate division WWE3 bacterium]
MKLEKYQKIGSKFLADNFHSLLGDDMGLGKTAQAIHACDIVNTQKVVVVCPASVKEHWRGEFEKWSKWDRRISVIANGRHSFDKDADVVIVNYELLLRERILTALKEEDWGVMICDEAHYLGHLTSLRTKAVLGNFGLARNAAYKWMLTGTPIESRPVTLFPMLYTLARKILGNYNTYEKFVMRYCDGYYDKITGKPMPNGASNELELKEMLGGFMLRRTLENELPKTDVQVVRFEKNIKLAKLETELSDEDREDFMFKPMEELGALASLRQEVALAKLPQCIDYIKDSMKVLDKLVIFAYHRSVINMLYEALSKFNPVRFYGGLTTGQRENVKNVFIKDLKCKIFIGQLKAAGTGLDGLQEVAHHMMFVEIDWVPFKQCIGRLKRKGQKQDRVVVQMLVCKDSIEEQMLGTVGSKLKSIDKILGD